MILRLFRTACRRISMSDKFALSDAFVATKASKTLKIPQSR
jgi:hypothetical protein